MLLHTLRQSRTLARWVLVWFVLAIGLAVAAPAVQPIGMDTVCSATSAGNADDGQPASVGVHHTVQCVLCLGLSAPPQWAQFGQAAPKASEAPTRLAETAVVLAPRRSPLAARAPPQA